MDARAERWHAQRNNTRWLSDGEEIPHTCDRSIEQRSLIHHHAARASDGADALIRRLYAVRPSDRTTDAPA